MMKNMQKNMSEGQSFDKSDFKTQFQGMDELTIDEMLTYAEASAVQSFDYNLTVSVNGSDNLEAVETIEQDSGSENESESGNTDENGNAGGQDHATGPFAQNHGDDIQKMPENDGKNGFRKGTFGTQGEFTLVGYSSDSAMTSFIDGTCSITDGTMFEEGTGNYTCVISEELAVYNDIDLASSCAITVTNPNNEEETYTLEVVGIYTNSQSTVTTGGQMGGFSTSTDPANQIYLSYAALASIVKTSEDAAEITTDEEMGFERTTALPGQTSGTYSFATVEDYETFEKEVYDMGLSDSYTVSSADVNAYKESLQPLENLNEMASYFLIVVLAIGAVILIVLNIFSVRERKYEVGVLTAIGMKKSKVSLQFLIETLAVTLFAVILGAMAGSIASVSVTNSLLASQVEAQEEKEQDNTNAFGREPGNMPGGGMRNENFQGQNGTNRLQNAEKPNGFGAKAANYIRKVDSAANVTVLVQLLGIGIGLALAASTASIVFIMRYKPLKILANRD